MPDYSKSKVYNIVCNITGQTYYGSTVQKISQRMNGHRNKVSKCLSKPIIERGDYHYGLVEDYKCDNLEQLLMRERYYIDNNDCVNKVVPGRTHKEWYETNKDKIIKQQKVYEEENKDKIIERNKVYNEANKDKISEQKKGYYEANKDKISERNKVYNEANKDKISERQRVYSQVNKDKITEYRKQRVVCECGCEIVRRCLSKHRKSKVHQEQKGYDEANKDKLLKQMKAYNEANKDKINEKKKEKVVCECGCESTPSNLSRHRKTKFHQEFIQSLASGGNTI